MSRHSERRYEPFYDDGAVTIYNTDWRLLKLPEAPALVLADPPYGIDHDADYRRFGEATNRTWKKIAGDAEPFDPAPLLALGRCVLFGGNYYAERLPHPAGWVVWNKRDAMPGKGVLADGELAWHNCGGKPVRVFNWLWWGCYRKGEMGSALHPTQKPVSLMRWLVEEFTAPGDLVFDPYMGSGPVARACADLGRRYIGAEVEEDYCKTAVGRLGQGVLDVA
jgi:site-specific DNA-methyltransferase (adenine-specific)